MARKATGVDVGRRSAVFLAGHTQGNTFAVTDYSFSAHAASGPEDAWEHAAPGFRPRAARVGLTGRDVFIRYTRVPRLPDWQLRRLMRFEVAEVGGQSGAELASDYNLLSELPELEGEDVVLLALAREPLLAAHLAGLRAAHGTLDAFSPNALALFGAWLRYGVVMEDTVLLADIGHENVDVVLARGSELLFARNLAGGGRLFDEAIAAELGVPLDRAERLKREVADVGLSARHADAVSEKASRACLGAAGQLLSLLQSAVLFCKSQVKIDGLRVERVLLSGGGALQSGLDRYLAAGLNAPVERFDPFRVVDTTALAPEAAAELETHRLESVVALGLATLGADPESYSVEILPASVRRRRELFGRQVFVIAAAVLALLWLGFDASRRRAELGRVRAEVRGLEARWERAQADDQRTRALLAENAERAALSGELFALAGAGEQTARALVALEQALPADFWLTHCSSAWRAAPELGVERGRELPILHVEGGAREGTESPAVLFERFVEELRARLPGVALQESIANTGDRFELDLTLLAPPAPAAPDAGLAEEQG